MGNDELLFYMMIGRLPNSPFLPIKRPSQIWELNDTMPLNGMTSPAILVCFLNNLDSQLSNSLVTIIERSLRCSQSPSKNETHTTTHPSRCPPRRAQPSSRQSSTPRSSPQSPVTRTCSRCTVCILDALLGHPFSRATRLTHMLQVCTRLAVAKTSPSQLPPACLT
jgi:hypothetical protein